MATFQVLTKNVPSTTPPKKHIQRFLYQKEIITRLIVGGLIGGTLITFLVNHGIIMFIFLPMIVSLTWAQAQHYNIRKLLNSTPAYLLLTICLTVVYYGAITIGLLLIHPNSSYAPSIIIITTSLAWAIMFEPIRRYLQALIEQRFNTRNREAAKTLEALATTLRQEIDLDQLCERFLAAIQQTMQPYSITLWLRIFSKQQERAHSGQEILIPDQDPLLLYVLYHPRTAEIARLPLTSPVFQDLQLQGANLLLPLANQGELIGLLILGPHLNGEAYTREERTMLETLAPQVAPALRVAQMVQEQQIQERKRGRIEQELHTAQDIQRTFLPKFVPTFPGWQITPYYQPAREVGGDFYDFLPFADGRLGLVIGDVTDKGVPAALVMTATRTMVRTAALEHTSPGEVLARVNELLYTDIPSSMFVTCFYAILDPQDGRLIYANAGHDLPYRRHSMGVSELWATGMPLGMMPGTLYEEYEIILNPGESILFYSDGLVEAHNPQQDMFDYARLSALIETHPGSPELIDFLLHNLITFTGSAWQQEDDITMMLLQRTPETTSMLSSSSPTQTITDIPSLSQ
jgi:serine phosphatase RsbU (regulator of sigma subunit)